MILYIRVVILITYLTFIEAKSDIQEVRLISPIHYVREYKSKQCYQILENKPLNIVFDNFYADNVKCWQKGKRDDGYFVVSNNNNFDIYDNGTTLLKISNVTHNMSTLWVCEIVNKDMTDMKYLYEIKIKDPNIQELHVDVPSDNLKVLPVQLFVIYESQPLHIILSNDENDVSLVAGCFKPDRTVIHGYQSKETDGCNGKTKKHIVRLEVNKEYVTTNISTEWRCGLKVDNIDKRTEVLFEIKVKASKKVDIRIGGIPRLFSPSDLSVIKYDGIYNYRYVEGETVDFSCNKTYPEGSLMWQYYDVHDNIVVESEVLITDETLSFRPLLTIEHNGSYVDCIYVTRNNGHFQKFTYRTQFIMKNEVAPSNFIVTIKDKKLILNCDEPLNGRDKYHFKFFAGEQLKISFEKVLLDSSDINISITYKNGSQMILTGTKNYVTDSDKRHATVYINTTSLDGFSLQCSSYLLAADIEFYEDATHDPVILGLPTSGILYEYSKNPTEWITYYKYTANEVLHLMCRTTTNRTVNWDFGDLSPEPQHQSSEAHNYINTDIYLKTNYNNTKITCEAKIPKSQTQRITITLHQKPEEMPVKDVDDGSLVIMIISGLSAILLIIIAAICAYYWCRGVQKLNFNRNPYDNFNNITDPIPAFPNQWESNEYTYIISNDNHYTTVKNELRENSLYFGSPQTNRITTENLCTEIGNNINKNSPLPYEHERNKKLAACSEYTENSYCEIEDNITNVKDSIRPQFIVPCRQETFRHSQITGDSTVPTDNPYSDTADSPINKNKTITPIYSLPYEQHEIKNKSSIK